MNFLCFSGKYTFFSSLNYISDLNQFFQSSLHGKFIIKGKKTPENLHFKKADPNKGDSFKSPKLTSSELLNIYNHSKSRLAQLNPASRRRKLSALKNFSQWCLENDFIDKNPLLNAPTAQLGLRLPHYLNIDELMAYFKNLKEDLNQSPEKFRNEFLNFLLLYGSGLRISEACQIKTKNIDYENGRIKILGKGKKERFAILPEFALSYFKKLILNSDDFIYGKKELNTRTAYNWIKKRALKAGLHKPVHPHMFRHSYATHLLREKTDLRHLQELLGHSSLVATQRYSHLDRNQILESLESFHPLSKNKNR